MLVLGLVALVLGLALDKDLVAIAGLATATFGVILERLEGPVEAGPQGFKGQLIRREEILQGVRSRAAADELAPAEAAKRVENSERLLPLGDLVVTEAGPIPSKESSRKYTVRIPTGDKEFTPEELEGIKQFLTDGIYAAAGQTRCADCGHRIDEPSDTPAEKRTPCPKCGSTTRSFSR